jgi:hypothetical protein
MKVENVYKMEGKLLPRELSRRGLGSSRQARQGRELNLDVKEWALCLGMMRLTLKSYPG